MAPQVVIVGGGFGGLDAARALAGAKVAVTLVDRHNYHLFQPLLYQVATASLSPADIASPIRWIIFWLFLHIFWLIGFRNRLAVVGEWAWSYVTFQRRVRLITGERLRPGL